eukprot:TRINITY_DN12443_c0_g1_i1.p1 TRINITY_DN12443_c0_g1~~TRINITY_DN12443_c0_g1_i1.p1  ORF type:complete len:742 (+),score=172.27 TRINITY_DN12443_c0_g1_i1:241-2466(+)
MGEFGAVLNGVAFWTRHNDYQLSQPRQEGGSANYNKLTPIAQPDVPPSVLSAGGVTAQIDEMREYFRAFAEQDTSIRDYTPFFKPILCVLEGAWIHDAVDLTEPFDSDRHFIDASSWEELNDMTRFLFNSGRKNNDENLPYLPSSIRSMINTEEFSFNSGSASGDIFANKLPFASARSYIQKERDEAQHFADDQLTVQVALNSEGLYVYIQGSRHGGGPAGGFTATTSCISGGCATATAYWCGEDGQSSSCRGDYVDGVGSSTLSYGAGKTGHVMYGPLTGRWEVSVAISGQTGLAGARVWKDGQTFEPVNFSDVITLNGFTDDPIPSLANFEYRIFCHPLKDDLPTNRLRVRDDISQQLYDSKPLPAANLTNTRRAIFDLNSKDSSRFYDGKYNYQLIDSLMEQIPGKDNYDADLDEILNGQQSYHYQTGEPLNSGYYSRYYQMDKGDAMGRLKRKRGFNDQNMWAARTTQEKVAGLSVFSEDDGLTEEKWTWAIPLEIIYLTPLVNWNPYDIVHHDDRSSTPTAGGRNGGFTAATAYDGVKYNVFYRTPTEFFSAGADADAADTAEDSVGVLDSSGTVRTVSASGHWIHFPSISGLDQYKIRQRYPIAPFHSGKTHAVALATALKHSLQSNELAQSMLQGTFINFSTSPVNLFTNAAYPDNALHKHNLNVAGPDVESLHAGNTVTLETDLVNGHTHTFQVTAQLSGDNWVYTVLDCDNNGAICLDGHSKVCETTDQCKA